MATWQSQIEADRLAGQLYHAYFVVAEEALALPGAAALFGVPVSEAFVLEDGSVAAMRQFLRTAAFKAQSGNFRLGLVPDMGALSLEAEQAFLKTLEEPGHSIRFLLFSRTEPRLSTTASRVRVLRGLAAGGGDEAGRAVLARLEQPVLSQAFLAAKELAESEEAEGIALAVLKYVAAEPSLKPGREKRLRAARECYEAWQTNASKRLQLEKLILCLR